MAKITVKDIKALEARAFMPSHYTLKVLKTSVPCSYDNEYEEGHYDLQPGDAKLEGTRGEHWSLNWENISKRYLFLDGKPVNPEECPYDQYVDIQTHPDHDERRKSVIWVVDASLVSREPFEINGLVIDPAVDMLCMGGDENEPNLDWGVWPVKREIFADTYELLNNE